MSDRFSRWLGRDRTESPRARSRVRNARRSVALESLEDRVLLTGIDKGDYYWYYNQKVSILRSTDNLMIGVNPGGGADTITPLTAAGGPLAGMVVTQSAVKNVWTVDLHKSYDQASLAKLEGDIQASAGVAFVSEMFEYHGTDGIGITKDMIVALKPGQDPAVVFGGPDFASYRPLLGTDDTFIVTSAGDAGPGTLALVNKLSEADSRVASASPDFLNALRIQQINDPLLDEQWHLHNTGQNGGTPGADAHAFEAWAKGYTGKGVLIATIDQGTQLNHPDLRIWTNPGEIPGNGKDDDGNGFVDDVNGYDFVDNDADPNPVDASEAHGTSVSGVEAAKGDDGLGGAGAAYDARVMSVRALGPSGGTVSAGIEAVYYAAGRTADGKGTWKAADILNNSYGGPTPVAEFDAAFNWAVTKGRGGLGAIPFASSGNGGDAGGYDGSFDQYPSGYKDVIAVGGTTEKDVRVSYSEYGPNLAFVTPTGGYSFNGIQNIVTTDRTGSAGYDPGDYTGLYDTGFNGTSSACPLASGVGALVLQVNPQFTKAQVQQFLQSTADKVGGVTYTNGRNKEYGYGRLNAGKAVDAAVATLLRFIPRPFSATEATRFDGAIGDVLNGTDPIVPSAFTVSIDWGDGQVSAGTVAQQGAKYVVRGSHTYGEGGTYTVVTKLVKIDGATASGSQQADVKGLPLTASGTTISLKEGDSFQGALAHFVDTSPFPQQAGHYSATIKFGDGSNGVGMIVASPAGGFDVYDQGGHIYGGGVYPVTVTISDPGFIATAQTSANVADSPLTAQGMAVTPTEGKPYGGALASFTDADPRLPGVSNYSATIDYGDGTFGAGIIQANPAGPGFIVIGDHPYSVGGYAVVVTISNFSGGGSTVALSTADVEDAPINSVGFNFNSSAGTMFSGILAAFQDSDPRPNPTSHYQATIEWGDGTREAGQIVVNEDGGYLVKGTHAYKAGIFSAVTTVSDIGGSVTVSSATASVSDAAVTLTLQQPVKPVEGLSAPVLFGQVKTPNMLAVATDYTATIDYGDGTSGDATIQFAADSADGRTFSVFSDKVYDAAGNYPISVVLTRPDGSQIQSTGIATVGAAPITLSASPIVGTSKTQMTGVTVATFTSGNPKAVASSYSASIDWGDGTTTAGTVALSSLGGFVVLGNHTYRSGGAFPVITYVTGTGVGSLVLTTAQISDRLTPVTGGAMSGPGGAISATGLTNSSQPIFTGTAEPFATVQIVGTTPAGSSVILGEGKAGANGVYTITSTPLVDGQYTIIASATDQAGKPSSDNVVLYPTASRGLLTVDTQGPKVTSAKLNPKTGKVTIDLVDGLSGLGSGVLQAGNYSLRSAAGKTYRVTGISVSPVSPNTKQTVTLTFATAKPLAKGKYVLGISAGGVADRAGNALDERYFVPFPGLYNQPGQNFTAAFTTDGRTISQATQFIPPAEIAAAKKHVQFVRKNFFPR